MLRKGRGLGFAYFIHLRCQHVKVSLLDLERAIFFLTGPFVIVVSS